MSQQQSPSTSLNTGTSPARITRIQEKEELAHLNDRFLTYIEQVRTMKEANYRLEFELSSTKEQLGKEADSVKSLYESELSDARNLIDETAKEKARQQIIASKHATRIDELEAELKDLKSQLEGLEAKLASSERSAASLDSQRKSALSEKSKLQKKVKDLEAELEDLRAQFDTLKEQLEAETLLKVDLQNNLQSLKEELAFKTKVYEEEVSSLRSKLNVHATGVFETDFQAQLDSRLESAIDELREKSEQEIAEYKAQVEAAYRDKIDALEKQSTRDATTIHKLNMEIRKFSGSLEGYNSDITKLQREIEKLEGELRNKVEELARLRQQHSEDRSHLVEELRELGASYELKIKEYQELMDVKVELDQEIATYRALLQEEESRLNLTPTPREKRTRSRTQASSEQVASKRPRLDPELSQHSSVSSSAAGCIQVCDVDPNGRYVQIKNMSNAIESLGGFKIVHQVDEEKEVTFKFHNKSKLQGGASVTVWGSESEGAVHNPPTDIIWRSQGTWGTGKKSVTKLVNKTTEVVATFTQRSETTPSKTTTLESVDSKASRSFPHIPEETERDYPSSTTRVTRSTTKTTTRYTSSSRGAEEGGSGSEQQPQVGEEHMFHQKGDPTNADKANCIIS